MKYFLYCRKSNEAEDKQALSIESQRQELLSRFSGARGVEIVGCIEECQSARTIGRPLFAKMLREIEHGKAEGIIAWHPDRLARNWVDGGRLIHLLDLGIIQDLKFSTFSFENDSQGKFMLSIAFGYSKYYIDSLSENVRRGERAKINRGWRPNRAPIGYLNDLATTTIVPDPERFPLVRRLFLSALTGLYSLNQLHDHARLLGLRPNLKFARPLSRSGVHHVLTNPFYYGVIRWAGVTYPGKHRPLVTKTEFDRVQEVVRRPEKARRQKHVFAYTGLIRCGECGSQITAEHQKIYIYYHCMHRCSRYTCTQPYLRSERLDEQALALVAKAAENPTFHRYLTQLLETQDDMLLRERQTEHALLSAEQDTLVRSGKTLLDLHLRGVVDEKTFGEEQGRLQRELAAITDRLAVHDATKMVSVLPQGDVVARFAAAAPETKHSVLRAIATDMVLYEKRLSFRLTPPPAD